MRCHQNYFHRVDQNILRKGFICLFGGVPFLPGGRGEIYHDRRGEIKERGLSLDGFIGKTDIRPELSACPDTPRENWR